MIEMLKKARDGKYAIAAPNICNEITARAVISAAEENNAPIIIDLVFKANPDIPLLTKMVVEMAEKATVPIALNLDYCISYEETMQALKLGFTSVSLDRTDKPLEQNIKETVEIVEVAHALNASVEGQLGRVVSARIFDKNNINMLTDPSMVKEYIEKTKIDLQNTVAEEVDQLAEIISFNGGHLTEDGKKYLDQLLAVSPDNYWLNLIKTKEK